MGNKPCIKTEILLLNKEDRHFESFMQTARYNFRLQVPKLLICIQAILCPEELRYVSMRPSPFSAVNISLPVY